MPCYRVQHHLGVVTEVTADRFELEHDTALFYRRGTGDGVIARDLVAAITEIVQVTENDD